LGQTVARPLRFCFLSSFYPPYSFGGDAVYLRRLADALARRGHEVDVIHCVDSYRALARGDPSQKCLDHPNVTIHGLHSHSGLLSPLVAQQTGMTWPKTNRILEVLFSKKFDVIHYHNISLLGPEVLRLAPDYPDFIKLYTAHEHWLICPMHVLWRNNERLCDKPQCLGCTLRFGRPPQWWRYTHLLERCAAAVDTFISPSTFSCKMHQERGFKWPMTVLPNFAPEPAPGLPVEVSSHPRPYFLFVGRLEKMKGVETLLPIFRSYPHADLLIAGDGTQGAELRRQAKGIRNVHFLGPLSSEQLPVLYRDAIALLVPSSGYEVFPLVILEAFQQRTPVISHSIGGLTEIVELSRGGFLYDESDEMLSAMEQLQFDPGLRQGMGDRGYQAYQEKWSEEAHLNNYFQILEETAIRKLGIVPWNGPIGSSLRFRVPALS
jgi:glycosyltransferase involved in cell wall biosynthesis